MNCSDPDAAGNRISDFISIGKWLRDIGLSTPEIYEVERGFVLLEDFGDESFKSAIRQGVDPKELYSLAHDAMRSLNAAKCPLDLPDFYESHVYDGRRFLIEWYLPLLGHELNQNQLMADYLEAWSEIENTLPEIEQAFLHVDYHVENLMCLPQRQGVKRCGILDFQGGMIGPKAYDLANLLEDARTDVPEEVKTQILNQYDEDFRANYRALATMFHCRLLGQFIKMAVEDNKEQYLQYLPRISHYIADAINDPVLKPLNGFFSDLKLDFRDVKRLNADAIKHYISKIKLAS